MANTAGAAKWCGQAIYGETASGQGIRRPAASQTHNKAIDWHGAENSRLENAIRSRQELRPFANILLEFRKQVFAHLAQRYGMQLGRALSVQLLNSSNVAADDDRIDPWSRYLRVLLSLFRRSPEPSDLHWPMMCVPGPKGPERFGASLKTKEDTMKLVSRFKAATCSTAELHGLLGQAQLAFAAAARGSEERREALESIRNIEKELEKRPPGP